ncbi:MAG: hypothetical protein FWD46_06310 [Cystobacterineae bacterium]|nr:hypothetical protein [Cystobacterineae bacterium]
MMRRGSTTLQQKEKGMHEDFVEVLLAKERAASIPEEDDWYGGLIGEWEFEWVDHEGAPEERHVQGEWLFARALEGRAIVDLFICPSRKERKRSASSENEEYGLSIRTYSPQTHSWHVCHASSGMPEQLVAIRESNGDIVQTSAVDKGYVAVWRFSKLTADSFCWTNRISEDGGKTWELVGEVFAKRRNLGC